MFDFFQEIKHCSMTHLYIAQRKRLKVLLENHRPLEDKKEFRLRESKKSTEKNLQRPTKLSCKAHSSTEEAGVYVERYFSAHFGTQKIFSTPLLTKLPRHDLMISSKEKKGIRCRSTANV
jgi:deoxyribodipyrimidine photolyase-like uncharacterized protein